MDRLSGEPLWLVGAWLVLGTLVVAGVVAGDARARGHSALGWGLLALLLPGFGALAYLVRRAPAAAAAPVASEAPRYAAAAAPASAPLPVPAETPPAEARPSWPTAAPAAPVPAAHEAVEWRRGVGVMAESPPPAPPPSSAAVPPRPAPPEPARGSALPWLLGTGVVLVLVVGALAALTDGFGLLGRAAPAGAPAAAPAPAAATMAPATAASLPTAAPGPTPAPAVVAAPAASSAPAAGEPVYYTVAEGDTLGEIALRHNTTVEALLQANNLDDPNVVVVGQRLLVSQ